MPLLGPHRLLPPDEADYRLGMDATHLRERDGVLVELSDDLHLAGAVVCLRPEAAKGLTAH